MFRTPAVEGFYWAKWRIADDSDMRSEYETYLPCNRWEVVDVFENSLNRDDAGHLRVHIPGVSHSQSLENFYWGDGPLEPPK